MTGITPATQGERSQGFRPSSARHHTSPSISVCSPTRRNKPIRSVLSASFFRGRGRPEGLEKLAPGHKQVREQDGNHSQKRPTSERWPPTSLSPGPTALHDCHPECQRANGEEGGKAAPRRARVVGEGRQVHGGRTGQPACELETAKHRLRVGRPALASNPEQYVRWEEAESTAKAWGAVFSCQEGGPHVTHTGLE